MYYILLTMWNLVVVVLKSEYLNQHQWVRTITKSIIWIVILKLMWFCKLNISQSQHNKNSRSKQ